jgi:hypothetical protein
MRSSIWAQSWLSTPPAPALTETSALARRSGRTSMRRNSILPTRASRSRGAVGGLEDAVGVLGLTPELVEGLGVVEALLGVAQVVDTFLRVDCSRRSSWALSLLVQNDGSAVWASSSSRRSSLPS